MMRRIKIKKQIIYGLAAAAMLGAAGMSVCAQPVTMPDGTVFDKDYYASLYPEIPMALGKSDTASLYFHYTEYGRREGRQGCAPGATPVGMYDPSTGRVIMYETTTDEGEETADPLGDMDEETEDPDALLEDEETSEGEDADEIPETVTDINVEVDDQKPQETEGDFAKGRDYFRNRLRSFIKEKEKALGITSPEEYYKDAVFVGDSIMLGFRNYAAKHSDDPILGELSFLAAGSFGANNALQPIGKDSVHPVYQGEQRFIWDSIAMSGRKKVFILLGLNDINRMGIDGSIIQYRNVLDKIKEATPDVKINIISMPYVLKGSEKGRLNSDSIRQYNDKLKTFAQQNGYGYLDIANPLADDEGNLAPKYCSDGFLHQTPAAYDVWTQLLRDFVPGAKPRTIE